MTNVDDVSRRLIQARQQHRTEAAPGEDWADAAAAYAVQASVADALDWFKDGSAPRHWKSGGPSRQAVLTHAPLPPAGVWASPADASAWPFQLRGIEAEIALRLGVDVDPARAAGLDHAAAAALVDAMCVSIEVVDSRWTEGLDAPPMAKLADLQSHGALVLGEWRPFEARDWSTQTCRVQIGHQAPFACVGSHPLADPAHVLPAWLRHATREGHGLAAGTVVTTGTWVGILRAQAGDRVVAEFPGIGRASVQL